MFAVTLSKSNPDEVAEPVYRLAIVFYAMSSLCEACTWIFLIFTRFTHSGQVCSGDYLSSREAPQGYCTGQRAIAVVAVILVVAIALTICVIPFVLGRKRRKRLTITQ